MIAVAYNEVSSDDASHDVRRRIGPDGPWDALVLNGRGRAFQTHSVGSFSLKWMPRGRARYEMDRRGHTVSCDTIVLLDDDQPYDMEFDARTVNESYCIFFSRDLVADAWASVEAGFAEANPTTRLRAFPNVPFAPSTRLAAALTGLRTDGSDADVAQLEARLLCVLDEAIATAQRHRRLVARLPAAKPATRAHLVRLVERARSILEGAHGVGWPLDALAADVGLSKFHLLRLFRAVHGVSPSEYAERVRMHAAGARLRATDAPISEIAARFGYESPSAFAKAFRRQRGVAPTVWRTAGAEGRLVSPN
jgi:AraC-like DNA-binding protein